MSRLENMLQYFGSTSTPRTACIACVDARSAKGVGVSYSEDMLLGCSCSLRFRANSLLRGFELTRK